MRPHRGTRGNRSHHGDSSLLKPTGIKIALNPCPVQPTENIGTYRRQDDVFGYELQFLLSGVLPVFQNLNYKPKRRLPDLLPNQQCPQKLYKIFSSSRRVTRRQFMRHFTGHGTDQCRNGLPNNLIPYREQPDQLGLLSPTHGQRPKQQTGQIMLRSGLISNPMFFKAIHHT